MKIKYRVWDKKAMVYLDQSFAKRHLVLSPDGEVTNLHNGTGGDELEAELWTGLVDSRGIEIYEGDILERRGERAEGIPNSGWQVTRDEGGWFIETQKLYDRLEGYEVFLVTGNIKENF